MKRTLKKWNALLKGFVLLLRPNVFLGWLRSPLLTVSNVLSLTKWISAQEKNDAMNDFYSLRRDYSKRYQLYEYVADKFSLAHEAVDYFEFGVSRGHSFKWWLSKCANPENKFYGFDTFEGLPENWGTYNKGDMAANIPLVDDARAIFVKGLFQNTVPDFLSDDRLKNGKRKIIHLDADLFSSTLYVLTTLAPYLKNGDLLLFDEFNVPNHEFFAFKVFTDSFYIKTKFVGAVNNYLQVALMIA